MAKDEIIAEKFNLEAIELWKKYFSADADVWIPLIYPPLIENSLLFVGLNPSFSQRGFASIFKNTAFDAIDPEEFYHWRNLPNFNWDIAIEIEKISKTKYAYFKKFSDVADYIGVRWEHIDLFLYRQTSQTKFKSIIMNRNMLNEFGKEQLRLSKKVITAIRPKAIVISNAFASTIFHKANSTKFDEKLGCHTLQLNGREIPIFYTSMLTGQRALDRYSYQRLKWHLKLVCDTLN